MSKIQVFRQSGTPVDPEVQLAYEADWKAFYDRAQERAGLDMLKLQRFLRFAERQLIQKHGSQIDIELPKTSKAWYELINKFNGTPVALAQRADGKGLVLILVDQGFA